MPITYKQQKYLRERLQSIIQTKPRHYDQVIIPDTAAVTKARAAVESATAIIEAHTDKVKDATKARRSAIEKMRLDCERMIVFDGDSSKILKALDAFEAKEF